MFQRKYRYSRKKAEKKPVEPEELTLILIIWNAENVEVASKKNITATAFNYVVIFSLGDTEDRSIAKRGSLQHNPVWDRVWSIPFTNMGMDDLFELEVVRISNRSDVVGTSTGILVVGRAHIPLPKKVGVKKQGRYALVKVDEETGCKVDAGHIYVSMELRVNKKGNNNGF